METHGVLGVKPRVLEILGGNPAIPYSIVANEVGVTRERVRQIAQKNGYPSRQGILKQKICHVCGKPFFSRKNTYCSNACAYKSRKKVVMVNCHKCGKLIERKPSAMRNVSGRYYCDRVCYDRSRGKNSISQIFHSDISTPLSYKA